MRPWHNKLQLSILGLTAGLILSASQPVQARTTDNAGCSEFDFSGHLLVMAPILKYTITNFDPDWFSEKSTSAPLFTLQILNNPQMPDSILMGTPQAKPRLWIQIDAQNVSDNSGSLLTVFNRITTLGQDLPIGVPLTSNQVFALNYANDPNQVEFEKSDLYNLVVNQHQMPQVNLTLKFALLCESGGIIDINQTKIVFTEDVNFFHDKLVLQVNNIQALIPGTNISTPSPVVINTQTPVFQISSPLIDDSTFSHPPGESNMEIFLYEISPDDNPSYAIEGQEFARFSADNFQVPYPPGLSMLEPGKVYAWRARGLLRGPESDYLYSNALYFQVNPSLGGGGEGGGSSFTEPPESIISLETLEGQVKAGDDYGKRVLAALKIILGENFEILRLAQTKMTPAKGAIRLNGRPYALEDLERLAKDFQQSSHGITRLRFQ